MVDVDSSRYGVPRVVTRDAADWQQRGQTLFRGDSRSPAEIRADGGFLPPYTSRAGWQRDPDAAAPDIALHVGGDTNAFVSTSTDRRVAEDFAISKFVYEINAPGGIYTDPTLQRVTGKETHGEGEVLFPGGVNWGYVRGWYEMRHEPGTGFVAGEFVPNPDYVGGPVDPDRRDRYGPTAHDAARDTSPPGRHPAYRPPDVGDRMGQLDDPRLDALRPHLRATEGGMAAFAPPASDDPRQRRDHQNEQYTANRVPRIPGQFVVDTHGSSDSVRIGDTPLSPRDLAEVIRANPDYDGGPVSLLGCNTGHAPDGFAARLAQELGVPVTAPDRDAWVDHDGNVFASSRDHTADTTKAARPTWPPNGEWRTYAPDGTHTLHPGPHPPGHTPTWGDTTPTRTPAAAQRGDPPAHARTDDPQPLARPRTDRDHPVDPVERGSQNDGQDVDRSASSRTDVLESRTDRDRADDRSQSDDRDQAADRDRVDDQQHAADRDRSVDQDRADERDRARDDRDTAETVDTFLLLCTEYSPRRGGVVVFNRSLAESLADSGQNVVVRLGEDATPYADAQRPNLRIIGPGDLPDNPDARDLLDTAHDPGGMPERVDYVVGHTRFSGPAAADTRYARYPDAKLVHFVHMVPEALGRVKEDDEPGEAAKGVGNHAVERDLVAGADLAVGVGPAIAENVREMVEQAEAAGGSVATQGVHELVPGMDFRDRRERSIEGREMNVFLFGRADVGQKGAKDAAEVVRMMRDAGHPVRLTLRGVPAELVDRQQRILTAIVGDYVEVRPFTTERSDLHADLDDADVMVMTSRAEGFGLTAQEAAASGVPVVVPSSSGFGRWLGESGLFSPERAGPSVVEQGFEERVPRDRWFEALTAVVEDYPAAQQRALELQQEFKDQNVTWADAAGALITRLRGLR